MNGRHGVCLILAICIVLVGCSGRKDATGAVLSDSSHGMTYEQMLEDYDIMWQQIEENYPLMGVAERTTRKQFSRVKEIYREQVSECGSDGQFFSLIQKCLEEFQGCGHMMIFSKDDYQYFSEVYRDIGRGMAPHIFYIEKVLQNDVSKIFYQYTSDKDISSEMFYSEESEAIADQTEPRKFPVQSVGEGIAYLCLPTFDGTLLDSDLPGLEAFFKEICDWDACIIDIRGNPGGNTFYWLKGIVEPNLRQKVFASTTELMRGETCKAYLSTDHVPLQPIDRLDCAKYPALNLSDLAQMQYYIEKQVSYQPSQSAPLFHGDFYLLTDEENYSAAEAFAQFCKSTGFATLVGARTGGDGIGIDPLVFVLPNSGICYRFSASLGLNSDGASNEEYGTEPDILCEGKDALEVCLKAIQEKMP